VSPILIALVTYVGYLTIVGVMWARAGVDYRTIGTTRESAVSGIIVPIGLGLVLLVAVVLANGWVSEVFRDNPRIDVPWYAWIPPTLMLVGVVAGLADLDPTAPAARGLIGPLLLGALLVGVAEEMFVRGIFVAAGREAGWNEITIALVSALLFGLLHGMNVLFGQPWRATILQVAFAAAAGLVLFLARMTTGVLVTAIVLHWLWDLGGLGAKTFRRRSSNLSAIAVMAASVTAVVVTVPALWP
jgi:membrane protease YdiL (CAAX protease family)